MSDEETSRLELDFLFSGGERVVTVFFSSPGKGLQNLHECLIHVVRVIKYKRRKLFDGRGIGRYCCRGRKQESACAVSLCGRGLWVGTSTLLGEGLRVAAWEKNLARVRSRSNPQPKFVLLVSSANRAPLKLYLLFERE